MEKQKQIGFWYFIFALFAILWVRNLCVNMQQVERITYNEIQRYLKEGRIESIAVYNNRIKGTFKEAIPSGQTRFTTI